MQVIPVLDLMIGQIVLAQGGNRDEYRPVHSRLTSSSQPLDVAQAIFNQTGCNWLYVADIDSFAGAAPNWGVYQQLLERGFGLWIDADWLTNDRYTQIADRLKHEKLKVIVSSETLSSVEQFSALETLAQNNVSVIFSLDKKGDAVISQTSSLAEWSPTDLVQRVYAHGVRDLIVLDLNQVGTGQGFQAASSSATLIQSLKQDFPRSKNHFRRWRTRSRRRTAMDRQRLRPCTSGIRHSLGGIYPRRHCQLTNKTYL